MDNDLRMKVLRAISSKRCSFLTEREKTIALELILESMSAKEKRDISLKIHLAFVGR